jgi:hypothetical protein
MAQRTVKTDKIKTLRDWVARWPKATNLGFDPETREATIYDTTKERVKVSSIPWKREADTMTVLAQPSRFSADAVTAATGRFNKIREQRDQMKVAGEGQLRAAEQNLLDAWRTYHAAPVAMRAPLRRDILSAEAAMQQLESVMAPKGRAIIYREDPYEKNVLMSQKIGMYVPPMPFGRRGISMVAGNADASEEPAAPAGGGAAAATATEAA